MLTALIVVVHLGELQVMENIEVNINVKADSNAGIFIVR